jgi:hypothetical protein
MERQTDRLSLNGSTELPELHMWVPG